MRKMSAVLLAVAAVFLTGCSNIASSTNSYLEETVMKQSGIYESETYIDYQRLEGSLEGGVYVQEESPDGEPADIIEESTEVKKQVHITFADNPLLQFTYYYDESLSVPVEQDSCYLNPGDSLFTSQPSYPASKSNMYGFDSFLFTQFGGDGTTLPTEESFSVTQFGEGYAILIPVTFSGTEISITPLGGYKDRILSFSDYYDDGQTHELMGQWSVNDVECGSDSAQVSPLENYIVSYNFPGNGEYYYVNAIPTPYYVDNDEGIAIFEEEGSNSDTKDYTVELHPYTTATVKVKPKGVTLPGQKKAIRVMGKEIEIPWNGAYSESFNQLKSGDTILVEADEECTIECSPLAKPDQPEIVNGRYLYTLTVPGKDSAFYFDPSQYHYDNGRIVFRYRGMDLSSPVRAIMGSQISYIAVADDGYWMPGGNGSITVSDEATTKQLLQNIRFYPDKQVRVSLPQPEVGGTIRYYDSSQNDIHGLSTQLKCGSVVKMDFVSWPGWTSSVADGAEYRVSEDDSQVVTINGKDVGEVFKEGELHQPSLSVKLNSSVGTETLFGVKTSNATVDNQQYRKEALKTESEIFSRDHVGTESGITISAKGGTLLPGTALRLDITMVDTNGSKAQDIQYITRLPAEKNIAIYSGSEIANSSKTYKSINIVISLVDAVMYEQKQASNATINVSPCDVSNAVALTNGATFELSRKVVVTVKPDNGYYVTGKNVSNNIYQEAMKYSKYLSDCSKILTNHPIKAVKLIGINEADAYGICVFKLNGKQVSGQIEVRDEDDLTLDYQISNSNYEIKYDSGGIGVVADYFKSKTKASVKIDISVLASGTTIQRSDYITVSAK